MLRRFFLRQLGGASLLSTVSPLETLAAPSSDRAYWISILEKLSEPLLTALAEDQLKVRMPVESRRGQEADRRKYSYLEALGRLLAGIGPWLALDTDDEKTIRQRYFQLAQRGIQNAVNPQAKDYMNYSEGGQPLVDAAFLAQGLLRCPKLYQSLQPAVQQQLLVAFRKTRNIRPGFSNWLLFSAMIEVFFASIGEEYDKMRLDYALRQHEQWYKGDGIFGDGPDFHWDYYNSYVIQPFMVDILRFLPDKSYDFLRTRMDKIAPRYAAIQERLIASDGSFPVIGRSICYRAGAFHHLANTAFLRQLPSEIAPAQVRSALTAVLHKTLDSPKNYDSKGWLYIGLNGHQPDLGESYISTGSLFLTAMALLPLGLPATDAFWANPATDWTSRRIWEKGENLPTDHAVKA
ncbi:DUF2264 domain-containing protein [Siphonobacter curvatus]|uniref:DUF2264 domain-containing protein n=1 Tax=Siphonobacter curvatus TaxID=2094562 RepID=A0A2S7IN30_9BACT|nr:DUF2264 domain-containing protein [Siphonobacter curvatus]PQA59059.1 hypothetical protein C5O19_05225 [Siphonobacter curvatus]